MQSMLHINQWVWFLHRAGGYHHKQGQPFLTLVARAGTRELCPQARASGRSERGKAGALPATPQSPHEALCPVPGVTVRDS